MNRSSAYLKDIGMLTDSNYGPTTSPYLTGLISAITIALFAIFLLAKFGNPPSLHAFGFDDAFITYRYAQHFFEGKGLVFNYGDYVEGYSNFLYVLLMAPAFLFPLDWVYPYSVMMNCLFFIITVCTFRYFLNTKFKSNQVMLGCLLLVLNPRIWEHAVSGMETMMSLALVTGSWVVIEMFLATPTKSRQALLLVLVTLSIFSRVDGFILPLSITLYAIIKKERRLAIKLCCLIITISMFYTVWRYIYYHDVIANTYYAKVTGDLFLRIKKGLIYSLKSDARTGFWIPICLIFWNLMRTIITRSYNKYHLDFASFFILIWSTYVILIGGDCYKDRFLVPLFAMGSFIVISSFTKLFSSAAPFGKMPHTKIMLIVFIGLFAAQTVPIRYDRNFRFILHKKDRAIATGKFLGQHYPNATLAVLPAGKIPFFSGLETIDMLGLNDKHIGKMHVHSKIFAAGHMKYDPDYVLSKEPTLILDWIDPNLNLEFGITKEKYQQKYHLKYLVNLAGSDKSRSYIVDVSHFSQKQIVYLIKEKRYFCAVLLKNSSVSVS